MRVTGARCCQVVLVLSATALLLTGRMPAYDRYSTNGVDNCAACHGSFRANPYTELAPGGSVWRADLMTVHVYDILSGDCYACHSTGGRFPVLTNSSQGGTGLSPISCAGCHGRAQDGTGTGTAGYGAGLRQHHWNSAVSHPGLNMKVCANCHTDANPANKALVGEDVAPPYYAEENANNHANHPNLPADACNLTAPFEDVAGNPDGLDNDGDGIYDAMDPDCSTVTSSPGETSGSLQSPLAVVSHDPVAGSLVVSYQGGCGATDNTLVYGPLSQVSTYGYAGQVCGIGNTGTFNWVYPSGALFFLVVGNDGAHEGSYGKSSAGVERPPFLTAVTCPLPQDLPNRCD